jgi:hypothetical protein
MATKARAMRELDWAGARRRHWSAPRIAAAVLLHLLVLFALKTAIDRVELQRHGRERETTLVSVALHRAAPPPPRSLPPPRRPLPNANPMDAPARGHGVAGIPRGASHEAPAIEDLPLAITPPAAATPDVEPLAQAVAPPASAPLTDRFFLDNAATRQAIRDVARGSLATRATALTREDQGSELVAADGSHTGDARHLPPPPPAQLLAQGIAAAHKDDCMKGEYPGAGMGLLSAPFLLAAEAMGKCSHK